MYYSLSEFAFLRSHEYFHTLCICLQAVELNKVELLAQLDIRLVSWFYLEIDHILTSEALQNLEIDHILTSEALQNLGDIIITPSMSI